MELKKEPYVHPTFYRNNLDAKSESLLKSCNLVLFLRQKA